MTFWIFVVLVSLGTIWAFIYFSFLEDIMSGLFSNLVMGALSALLVALTGAIVGGATLALLTLIPAGHMLRETHTLASLGDTQGVEGRFYLGSGYINGTREIAYVKQLDGYSVATEADGDASRIFQDTSKPTVTEYTYFYSNPWVLPWNFDTGYTYDFHVPAGTIQNNYAIGANS